MINFDAIRSDYGAFWFESTTVSFNPDDVPVNLHELIPYAGFWGLSDDVQREQLVGKAPEQIKQSLKQLIAENDDALDAWLAGTEASSPKPSDAYLAFSAMRIAADFV